MPQIVYCDIQHSLVFEHHLKDVAQRMLRASEQWVATCFGAGV